MLLCPITGGLRIAIDRACKGKVYRLDWIKFFRQWKSSNMPMETYVRASHVNLQYDYA